MSMNLVFYVKDTHYFVDFPFQTSTDLTYKVLVETSVKERFAIIENAVKEYGWDDDITKPILLKVKALLESETLELGMI